MADPNIPGWLTKMSGWTKHLDLEKRQKMLPSIVGKLHKSGLLSELVGEDLSQPAVYMAHFLGGSGEPLELEISDEEWESLAKKADRPGLDSKGFRMDKSVWTPSTNPKYHADQGWEWKQIETTGTLDKMLSNRTMSRASHLYNILGKITTIRRRDIGDNKYEYQIAEDFDFTSGVRGEDYSEKTPARKMHPKVAKLIESVFPEYTNPVPYRGYWHGIEVTNKLRGVPVPIKSSYIRGKKNTEDKIMDLIKDL